MAMMDLRAREIAKWRKSARKLATQLAEMEDIAADNDRLLLALHQLAILLIRKNGDWRGEAEALLRKRLGLCHCQWRIFSPADARLARAAARLKIGGEAASSPLAEDDDAAAAAAAAHFHLPIRKGRKTVGLLSLAARKKGAFSEDGARDFTRRLAELLAAAA